MKLPTFALLAAAALSSTGGAASAFVLPSSSSSSSTGPLRTSLRELVEGKSDGGRSAATTAVRMAKARGEGYGPPLENISEAVGNTPMVKISDRICPPGRTIYAKCEYFNPLSSVKDRLALAIIEAAEADGSLKPGQTVVEATSGNTGIGESLAIDLCTVSAYICTIVWLIHTSGAHITSCASALCRNQPSP